MTADAQVPQHMCGGQRTTLRGLFSPHMFMRVPGANSDALSWQVILPAETSPGYAFLKRKSPLSIFVVIYVAWVSSEVALFIGF